ncbi:hypothetical protein [EBPR siphovirus 2]|nr:hypothetical protein [EBPR siphovirus 2]
MAEQKNARSLDFKTPTARVSYARSLFEARAVDQKDPNSKKKFGATLIFPKAAMTDPVVVYDGRKLSLQDIVAEVIIAQWGEKGIERAKAGLIKSPFLAGDGKEARNKTTGELHPGMGPDVFFIRTQANLEYPPGVYASATDTIPATQKEVYSGCFGFGVVNFFAWHDSRNGDGISCGIRAFFKRSDGDKLGGEGGGSPEQWLDEKVDGAGPAPESTRSGGGAGSLFGNQ